MNDEIEIAGNKKAEIKSIAQRHTYSGLLEGLPTREMNARLMQNTVEEAKKALLYTRSIFN
jgi:hypothetical protein